MMNFHCNIDIFKYIYLDFKTFTLTLCIRFDRIMIITLD